MSERSEFVASNGITVTTLADGQVGFRRRVGNLDQYAQWLTPAEAQAFAESVQARLSDRAEN